MFIHKSLLTRKEKISPHRNIFSLISVINFIDMIPRSATVYGKYDMPSMRLFKELQKN